MQKLLPIHTFITDKHLIDKGLTNYWMIRRLSSCVSGKFEICWPVSCCNES